MSGDRPRGKESPDERLRHRIHILRMWGATALDLGVTNVPVNAKVLVGLLDAVLQRLPGMTGTDEPTEPTA